MSDECSTPGVPEAFKREAIDRVANSGLTPVAVARELGSHDTVLRRGDDAIRGAGDGDVAVPPRTQASSLSPSDLAAEVARLRRDNGQLRMERDILKKPRSSSEQPPDEVRVRRWASSGLAGPRDVRGPGAFGQRLLRLARSPESQRSVANRELTEDIRLIHAESSGCYGSPRVHATLRRHGRECRRDSRHRHGGDHRHAVGP